MSKKGSIFFLGVVRSPQKTRVDILTLLLSLLLILNAFDILLSSLKTDDALQIISDYTSSIAQNCSIVVACICVLIALYEIVLMKLSGWYFLYLLVLLMCASLCLMNVGAPALNIFILLAVLISSPLANNKKMSVVLLSSLLIRLMLSFVLYGLGITSDAISTRVDTGTLRHTYGFVSPNTFAVAFLSLLIVYLYVRKNVITLLELLILAFCLIYINSLTDSRVSFCVGVVSLVLFAIYRYKRDLYKNRVIGFFMCLSPIILMAASLSLTFGYRMSGNTFFLKINDILSYRLYYINRVMDSSPLSALGHKLRLVTLTQASQTGEEWLGIDNAYMYLILQFGLIFSIAFYVFLTALSYSAWRNHEYGSLLLLFICSIVCFTENNVLSYVICPMFLALKGSFLFWRKPQIIPAL